MFLLEPGDAKAIAQAFCAAFDDCTLWTAAGLNWMLVGTRDARSPGPDVNPHEWSEGRGGEERKRLGFATPAWLAATFLGDAAYVRQWAAGAAPLEDNWPYRLSPHIPPQDRPAAEYTVVMDGARARRRFVESAWVRQFWGQALRDQVEALFEQQQMLNGALVPAGDPWYVAFENAARAGAAAHVQGLLLGVTPDELHLAEQALARGGSGPVLEYYLGVRALSSGDAGEAVHQLGRLHARNPGVERIAQVLAIALCHDGRPAAGADVASRFRSGGDPFWIGFASRCRASAFPDREKKP
jgi:hypothetical protein